MIHKYSRYIYLWWDRFSCYLQLEQKNFAGDIAPTGSYKSQNCEINIIQERKRVGVKHNIPLKGALFYHVCIFHAVILSRQERGRFSSFIIGFSPSLGSHLKLKFWFSSLAGIREKCSGKKTCFRYTCREYLLNLQWPF